MIVLPSRRSAASRALLRPGHEDLELRPDLRGDVLSTAGRQFHGKPQTCGGSIGITADVAAGGQPAGSPGGVGGAPAVLGRRWAVLPTATGSGREDRGGRAALGGHGRGRFRSGWAATCRARSPAVAAPG